jgi:hypothetical protein
MTGPSSTTTPTSPDPSATDQATSSSRSESEEASADDRSEIADLAKTQDDVVQRARRLAPGEFIAASSNGHQDDQRVERLLDSARAGLLAELRDQGQEQARRQLEHAARSSEDAVAGVVQGVTTLVRSIVPAALVRPEDVIEASFALADQGLRVGRRLALAVTSGVRSRSPAATSAAAPAPRRAAHQGAAGRTGRLSPACGTSCAGLSFAWNPRRSIWLRTPFELPSLVGLERRHADAAAPVGGGGPLAERAAAKQRLSTTDSTSRTFGWPRLGSPAPAQQRPTPVAPPARFRSQRPVHNHP